MQIQNKSRCNEKNTVRRPDTVASAALVEVVSFNGACNGQEEATVGGEGRQGGGDGRGAAAVRGVRRSERR